MSIVETSLGPVRGFHVGPVRAFLGIPYAAPPFGPHRFAAPRPASPWREPRAADQPGPRPPQLPSRGDPRPWSAADGLDCLNLNVWAPVGGERLPVLCWFHGGAYISGSNDMPLYDGARIAAAGAVVVAPNYRLGFEGFGRVPARPDNRGFLDQLAALGWVAANAAAFGGDPSNVTIWGQSAGAASVLAMMANPAASGMFHRAIAQSVPRLMWTPETAERVAATVAELAGVPYTLAGLTSCPPERLAAALPRMEDEFWAHPRRWGAARYSQMPMQPVLDREAVPRGDVDLLIGFNRDECRLLLPSLIRRLRRLPPDEPARAAEAFGFGPDAPAAYRAAHPHLGTADLFTEMWSDWLFRLPTSDAARAHAATGAGRTYRYEFAWPSPALGGALRACHSLELPFVFGNLDGPGGRTLVVDVTAPGVRALSAEIRAAWLDFARTGRPGWAADDPVARTTKVWDGAANPAVHASAEPVLSG